MAGTRVRDDGLEAPGQAGRYEDDVLLWSLGLAAALRERRFADLDLEHLAGEMEDVGESENENLQAIMRFRSRIC